MIKRSLGSLAGNALQFYDFTIYAFLAPYISLEFFNCKSQFVSYLMVFGVFASGYLTRPLGALLFGYIGDRKGRSYALSKTIIISTLSTFMMGVIPGYEVIGTLAPIFLITLRLAQGIAVSGEEGGAVVLLFEKYSFKNREIVGGIVLSSVLVGVIIGTVVCFLMEQLINHKILSSWAWRIPFLLAFPFGAIALALRLVVNDYNSFNLAVKNNLILKMPTRALFSNYAWTILYGFCVVSIYSITTSTLIVHLPYFLTIKMGYKHDVSLMILTLAISFIAILTPLLGKRLAKFDSRVLHNFFILGLMISSPILFYLISLGSLIALICAILIFSSLISLVSSTVFSILVGIFPYNVRYSGVSLAFNLAVTLFSSTTPLVLIFVENTFDNSFAPGLYLSLLALIIFCTIHVLHKKLFIPYFNENKSESFMYQVNY